MYYVQYQNYLMHHGVKGMKWGVRKDPESVYNRTRNIAKYGWAQGHGINVNNRINRIKNDKSRQAVMSKRQKKSLENASKYWSNRAQGKSLYESGQRNFIKREADSYRSLSLKRRAGIKVVQNALAIPSINRTREQYGLDKMVAGEAALQTVKGTAGNLVVDELLNRAFGHY